MNESPDQSPEQGPECARAEQAAPVLDAPQRQYYIFRAGRERLCLPVTEVEEVVEWPRLTSIPLSPPFLMGIFHLRGRVVPVVDLAYEHRSVGEAPKRVVVACLRGDGRELRLGLVADEIAGAHASSEPLRSDEAGPGPLDLKRVLESFSVGVI